MPADFPADVCQIRSASTSNRWMYQAGCNCPIGGLENHTLRRGKSLNYGVLETNQSARVCIIWGEGCKWMILDEGWRFYQNFRTLCGSGILPRIYRLGHSFFRGRMPFPI